jgi:hypothetical protein
MSVQLNLGNNTAYNFNETRLTRVMNATTLAQATEMGLWDRFKDFFNGGVKRQAIESLFNELNKHAHPSDKPLEMLEKFEKLQHMATPEHKEAFQIQTSHEDGQWNYCFTIDNQPLYHSGPLKDTPESSFKDFCAAKIGYDMRTFIEGNPIFDKNNYVECNIQCMTDDPHQQKLFQNNLQDPKFGRQNLTHITVPKDASPTFTAHFTWGDVTLSNRDATRNEFRAERLQKALLDGNYQNLEDLCSQGHLTRDDTMLLYLSGSSKGNLCNLVGENLNSVASTLHAQPIGHTTLGDLFGIAKPEMVAQSKLNPLDANLLS